MLDSNSLTKLRLSTERAKRQISVEKNNRGLPPLPVMS